ncbi:hypothetical protein [Streptomyces sp. NPDC055085]
MKYVKETTPYGSKRHIDFPFGLQLFWGKTEFDTYVWIGTRNGGISIDKDHP